MVFRSLNRTFVKELRFDSKILMLFILYCSHLIVPLSSINGKTNVQTVIPYSPCAPAALCLRQIERLFPIAAVAVIVGHNILAVRMFMFRCSRRLQGFAAKVNRTNQ